MKEVQRTIAPVQKRQQVQQRHGREQFHVQLPNQRLLLDARGIGKLLIRRQRLPAVGRRILAFELSLLVRGSERRHGA